MRSHGAAGMTLASNFWFDSPIASELTAGTRALQAAMPAEMPVWELFVDTNRRSPERHGIADFRLYRRALRRMRRVLLREKPQRVALLGGGCAATIATIPYLASRYPDLHVVWADAHCDMNTPATSGSGYLHGMPLGVLQERESYRKFFRDDFVLDPNRILFFGQKAIDPPEQARIQAHGIPQIDAEHDGIEALDRSLSERGTPPVYLHLDLDVLHPAAYPNPKCEISAGLQLTELPELIGAIARNASIVGYSIAENPEADHERSRAVVEPFAELFTKTTQT